MSPTTAKSERRKKLRKKPLRLIYVELAFGNGGMMRDLSEDGFAVRAMMPLKQGDKTPFSFMLGESTRVEGEGKVLWIDEGGRVAAVQFTQIAPELRSRLDDWLIEDEKIVDPRDAPREPKIAPAATIEELKEEIRTTPVRPESSAPVLDEQTPAAPEPAADETTRVHGQPPPHVETPKTPEPKISPPPSPPLVPDTNIVTREPAVATVTPAAAAEPRSPEKPPVTREIPRPAPPKVEAESSPRPVSSVTEGFFRKWPKQPPDSASTAETRLPELPALPPLPPTKSRIIEEETEDPIERKQSLPDISEILIQPHGLSPHHEATPPRSPDPSTTRQSHRAGWEWFTLGRALAAMIALTVLVGFVVYHRAVGNGLIWLGEALGGAASTAENAPSPNASDVQINDAAQPQPVRRSPTVPPASAPNGAPRLDAAAKGSTAPVTPLASPEVSPDSGQAEYLQAVQLMRGRNATNDTAEAVRLLWIAVEKGNPSAEVALADLYWHGHGVARNCDQARILFTAAARKGSSEAQKQLQQFQQEGCE